MTAFGLFVKKGVRMYFGKNCRTCYIFLFFILWLGINLITRTVLLGMACVELPGAIEGWKTFIAIFLWGTLNDIFPFFLLVLPLLPLCLAPGCFWKQCYGRFMNGVIFWIYCSLVLFGAVAEYFFWEEFHARFNFIAVDYLIYTTEVVRNIYESYPVIPFFAGIFAISAGITFFSLKKLYNERLATTRNWICIIILLLGSVVTFFYTPLAPTSPIPRELATNGVWSLFSAYRNNQLNYHQFYPIIDDLTAGRCLHNLLKADNARFLSGDPAEWRRFIVSTRPEKKWNVIEIVVESLGSNLLGQNTPELNRLIPQSLFFSNLRATGTRTVRGIEALTLSLPPTPGTSIVRRPDCEGLFTIGTVFRQYSYDTSFIYGGYGYFDNMNAFFAGNGFRIVDRSTLSSDEITFTSAWGVCDEDLFNASLREADACARKHKPFYQFVLTTSNHRPFTYPQGKVDIVPGSGRIGAVKYTDYALGDFLKRASQKEWFKNTLFVIIGDHTSGAAGKTDLPPSRYLIPGIIYSPGNVAPGRIDTLCSQIDIAPTLFDLLGWSYQSKFFGQSILTMPPQKGRAWIGTYQLLGYLTTDTLVTLAPRKEPAIEGWNNAAETSSGVPLPQRQSSALLEAQSSYQRAHDLFNSGAIRE